MKTLISILALLFICANYTDAQTNKRVYKLEYYVDGDLRATSNRYYDDKGRLNKAEIIENNGKRHDITATYSADGKTITMVYSGPKLSTSSDCVTKSVTTIDNGRIVQFTYDEQSSYGDNSVTNNILYDSDGSIQQIEFTAIFSAGYEEGPYTFPLAWNDGNVSSFTVDASVLTFAYSDYATPASLPLRLDLGFMIDLDVLVQPHPLIYANTSYLGKRSNKLPAGIVRYRDGEERERSNYSYTFDGEGNVTAIDETNVYIGQETTTTLYHVNFYYEEGVSGISGVSASASAAPVGVYSVAGQKLAEPSTGINIIKDSAGKTTKVIK